MFNFGRKDIPLPNNVIIIVNNAVQNTGVHVSFQISDFFSRYIPRSGRVGSGHSSIFSCLIIFYLFI